MPHSDDIAPRHFDSVAGASSIARAAGTVRAPAYLGGRHHTPQVVIRGDLLLRLIATALITRSTKCICAKHGQGALADALLPRLGA